MHKGLRIAALVAVVAVVLIAIIASVSYKPSNFDQVWDGETTLGNPEGSNYFVVYSDLACPYCIAFENAILEHEEDFQKYLENNDILFEVRLSDYLYQVGPTHPNHSRYGAVAAYCAKNEGKFWDYYNNAIRTTWNDFYRDNGKEGGQALAEYDKSYWIDLASRDRGHRKNRQSRPGMPYYKFNKYANSGFDMAGDWNDVMNLFQLGLESK